MRIRLSSVAIDINQRVFYFDPYASRYVSGVLFQSDHIVNYEIVISHHVIVVYLMYEHAENARSAIGKILHI